MISLVQAVSENPWLIIVIFVIMIIVFSLIMEFCFDICSLRELPKDRDDSLGFWKILVRAVKIEKLTWSPIENHRWRALWKAIKYIFLGMLEKVAPAVKHFVRKFFFGEEKAWEPLYQLSSKWRVIWVVAHFIPLIAKMFAAHLRMMYAPLTIFVPEQGIAGYQLMMFIGGICGILCFKLHRSWFAAPMRFREEYRSLIGSGEVENPVLSEQCRRVLNFLWAIRRLISWYSLVIIVAKIFTVLGVMKIQWVFWPRF